MLHAADPEIVTAKPGPGMSARNNSGDSPLAAARAHDNQLHFNNIFTPFVPFQKLTSAHSAQAPAYTFGKTANVGVFVPRMVGIWELGQLNCATAPPFQASEVF